MPFLLRLKITPTLHNKQMPHPTIARPLLRHHRLPPSKVLWRTLFGLIGFICLTTNSTAAGNPDALATENICAASHIDSVGKLKYVSDGDTIVLQNGDKIRLIGINTPEVAHKSRNGKIRAAEPYGQAASDYLKQLLRKNTPVQLQLGEQAKDRYGRTLAHVFLANGENIQVKLLQQGLATTIAIPPNTVFASCYQAVEQQARCHQAGLWSLDSSILPSTEINSATKGFHLVTGKVEHIETNRHGTWLHLAGDLTLGIRPENKPLFDMNRINTLTGKTLLVRGWVNRTKKKTAYIRIRHPLSLSVADSSHCSTEQE